MNSERFRVYLGFFIVSTVWGSTWLAIKLGLETLPPFLAAGMRFVIAAAVLYVIIRWRGIRLPFTPDARRVYLTLGILSFSIPFALVYWGQQFIPSGLSSVLFGVYPFWVAVFSHLMLNNERLDMFKIAGTIAGFLGIVVIFAGDITLGGSESLYGMSAVLLSTMLQGYSLIVVKKYGQPISPFAMNLAGMVIGAVLLLGLSLVAEREEPVVFTATAVGSILYLAIVGSVLTFVSYYWLVKRINAVYLSLTSFINPIVAVLLGALVLGETLAPGVVGGAALVLFGIFVANGRYFYEKRRSVLEE